MPTKAEIARELARLSCDCSFLLTHLIREKDRPGIDPKAILKSILAIGQIPARPKLRAKPVGWYKSLDPHIYNYATGDFTGTKSADGVCFTESTLAGLKGHCEIFKARYGLAFHREFLFERGANPCLNIRYELFKKDVSLSNSRSCKIFNVIPTNLQPFVNIITESFDATHEREWRIAGDLSFNYGNVWFVFCPEVDFDLFWRVQTRGRPILFDLEWLSKV